MLRLIELVILAVCLFFGVEKQKRDSKKPQVHKFELKIMNTREGKPNMPQAPNCLLFSLFPVVKTHDGALAQRLHLSTLLLWNTWKRWVEQGSHCSVMIGTLYFPYPIGWIMIFMGWLYIYVHLLHHQNQAFMYIPHMDPMGMFFYFEIIGDSTHLSTSKHVTRKTCSGYFLKLFLGFDFSLLGGVSIHNSSPWFFGTIFRWTSQTASLPPETRLFGPEIIFQSIDVQQQFFVRFGESIRLIYLAMFCWWFRNPAITTWDVYTRRILTPA